MVEPKLDTGSDLPAPYVPPSSLLWRDLRAVLASFRLKIRELLRRNAAGELPTPAIWPRGLAPFFWPGLVLVLLLVALLLVRLGPFPQRAAPGIDPEPSSPGRERLVTSPLPEAELLETARAEPESPGVDAAEVGAPAPPGEQPSPAPVLELDPLLSLLAVDDPRHWIVSANPDPSRALLSLSLSEGFLEEPHKERNRWAERWCERSLALGYERLELRASDGRLLARNALVGSGMILLDLAAAAS